VRKIGEVWNWKGNLENKGHWLVEVPSLNIMTQGETREEALYMIKDAIIEYMKYYFELKSKGFELEVNDKKSVIGITTTTINYYWRFLLESKERKVRQQFAKYANAWAQSLQIYMHNMRGAERKSPWINTRDYC